MNDDQQPADCKRCGHERRQHIYEQGACRPGFACPCEGYTTGNEGATSMSKSVRYDTEIRFPIYGGDVQEVLVVIEGGEVPTEIGATFTCRVTGIKREVVER